jgi:hypothetical protein
VLGPSWSTNSYRIPSRVGSPLHLSNLQGMFVVTVM